MMDRMPPQDVQVEQAVLSAMMITSDAIGLASETLENSFFYNSHHGIIFDAIIKLFQNGIEVDTLTLTDELKKRSKYEEVGGVVYISKLASEVASAANIKNHIQIVLDRAIEREIIITGREAESAIYDGVGAGETIEKFSNKLMNLSRTTDRKEPSTLSDIFSDVSSTYDKASASKRPFIGLDTGFSAVNYRMGGFMAPDLIILAARPSIGKSSLAFSFALNVAKIEKKGVGIFSCEMSKQQVGQRILSTEAMLSLQELRQGRLNLEGVDKMAMAMSRFAQLPIYVDDTAGLSIVEMRSKCRRLKQRYDIGLWVVDYLQLMTGQGNSENERLNMISTGLKNIAKDTDTPVLALSQLNRSCESRPDKRPQLSDLRGSGGIEQDADIVLMLYRPGYYEELQERVDGKEIGNDAALLIEKQRNGPTGQVPLVWIPESACFAERAPYDSTQEIPENYYEKDLD
jgi:replicative DNA helicase